MSRSNATRKAGGGTENGTEKARLVHAALQTTVEAQGTQEARRLFARYAELNAEHFGGKLGVGCVLITATAPRALGDYIARDAQGIESRIRIREGVVVSRCERYQDDVLLHEMVHAWCWEIEGDDEPGYRGHGPKFAAKCNEIGAKLGLGEVKEKGRGGKPNCAQWPLNVRPEGYYPDEQPKPEPKAPESKSKPESNPDDEPASSRRPADPMRAVRHAEEALRAVAEATTLDQARKRAQAGIDALQAALAGQDDRKVWHDQYEQIRKGA